MIRPYSLTKEFIKSLSKVGEENYKKIDTLLEEMSKQSIKDLYRVKGAKE